MGKSHGVAIAQESDFYGSHRRPHGVDSQHLRVIKDTALRSRLIMAGMAEGLQSPKGPQKIASIVRLYADFNAPAPVRGARTAARRPNEPSRSAYGLPTVEELNRLLSRITTVERTVSSELQGRSTAISRVSRVRSRISRATSSNGRSANSNPPCARAVKFPGKCARRRSSASRPIRPSSRASTCGCSRANRTATSNARPNGRVVEAVAVGALRAHERRGETERARKR